MAGVQVSQEDEVWVGRQPLEEGDVDNCGGAVVIGADGVCLYLLA